MTSNFIHDINRNNKSTHSLRELCERTWVNTNNARLLMLRLFCSLRQSAIRAHARDGKDFFVTCLWASEAVSDLVRPLKIWQSLFQTVTRGGPTNSRIGPNTLQTPWRLNWNFSKIDLWTRKKTSYDFLLPYSRSWRKKTHINQGQRFNLEFS